MVSSGARFKHFPVGTCFGPATILYLLRENNRRELPSGSFDHGVCGAITSNHNSRLISFLPVEANGDTVVHREADCRAIWGELTIGDARKGLRKIDVACWEKIGR